MSPFPKVIKTRIEGRKVKRFIRNEWVIVWAVRPDTPNVIWVHWVCRVGERRVNDEYS